MLSRVVTGTLMDADQRPLKNTIVEFQACKAVGFPDVKLTLVSIAGPVTTDNNGHFVTDPMPCCDGISWYYMASAANGEMRPFYFRIPDGTNPIDISECLIDIGAWNKGVKRQLLDVSYLSGVIDMSHLGFYPGRYLGVKKINGTAYTVGAGDESWLLLTTSNNAVTITLPNYATTQIPVGGHVDFSAYGNGAVTFKAGSGAIVHGYSSLTSLGEYVGMSAIKIGTDEWLVIGGMK